MYKKGFLEIERRIHQACRPQGWINHER